MSFVLEAKGAAGPSGAIFVRQIGQEELYRIPESGMATLTSLSSSGAWPPGDAVGEPISVRFPNPTTWTLKTSASTTQILRLRLTYLPGWVASIDGKPLSLERYSGIMLEARIPAGTHTIVVHYWPLSFTAGIIFAIGSAMCLCFAIITAWTRKGRSQKANGG